jgi:hypothetical protein
MNPRIILNSSLRKALLAYQEDVEQNSKGHDLG